MISDCKIKYSKAFYDKLDTILFRLILCRLLKDEDTIVVL